MLRGRDHSKEKQIAIIYFYEELPVRTIGKIVLEASATLDRYISISIRANHMDMTKFLSNEDPDYRNVLSELQRFIESGQHQSKRVVSASPESSNNGEKPHREIQKEISSAGEQDQAAVHGKASSKESTKLVNNFSGNLDSGGGKMIQGNTFNSGGGSMSF
ncbi:uncharacterized protein KY384_000854 [Bacidia gigantensis]|uniref:uncharacterized protein n=1 Tax=Bacidia gigantensis TaxID=2732470 RepID=UPI001D0555BC|nr:uncharacterized protein KY384_000854 [Bacidia gigantensis]KAG8534012.1 hypothetical protein KY384_000854 [Bacidia gigantensis]